MLLKKLIKTIGDNTYISVLEPLNKGYQTLFEGKCIFIDNTNLDRKVLQIAPKNHYYTQRESEPMLAIVLKREVDK